MIFWNLFENTEISTEPCDQNLTHLIKVLFSRESIRKVLFLRVFDLSKWEL
jgi:hypothetical protein